MVIQHDRAFAEQIQHIGQVLDLFDGQDTVRYIGFPSATTKDYINKKLINKYGLEDYEQERVPLPLVPLVYWYDSTHIARTSHYKDLIRAQCKIGQFIETTYGARIEKEIAEQMRNGNWTFDSHLQNYGMFWWWEGGIGMERAIVRHLDGRGFYTMEERIKKGWPAVNHHMNTVKDIINKILAVRGKEGLALE